MHRLRYLPAARLAQYSARRTVFRSCKRSRPAMTSGSALQALVSCPTGSEHRPRVVFLRLMVEHEHNLSRHIDVRVVVVSVLRSGNPVSGKNHRRAHPHFVLKSAADFAAWELLRDAPASKRQGALLRDRSGTRSTGTPANTSCRSPAEARSSRNRQRYIAPRSRPPGSTTTARRAAPEVRKSRSARKRRYCGSMSAVWQSEAPARHSGASAAIRKCIRRF